MKSYKIKKLPKKFSRICENPLKLALALKIKSDR